MFLLDGWEALSICLIIRRHWWGSEFVIVNRAKLDNNARLLDFTEKLEAACIGTVESGKMTKDLALIIHGSKYASAKLL